MSRPALVGVAGTATAGFGLFGAATGSGLGFGVAGVAAWEALAARLAAPGVEPLAAGITVWLFGMGIGALNEVVEFAIALNVEDSNVGGYLNTGRDLVANMLGSAAAGIVVARRVRAEVS